MNEARYDACRARVDNAHRRMRAVGGGAHGPSEVRQAAAELTAALRDATDAATQLLRHSPAPSSAWSLELVRLSEIAVWLRRTTLDQLGVHVPTTVRVGSYAANGPHIAGMGFHAGDGGEWQQPRIGLDLVAVVDGVEQGSAAAPRGRVHEPAPARAA